MPDEKILKDIHSQSSNHIKAIKRSSMVGCFYCKIIFDPKSIVEWVDSDTTAICPHCGVDAVLPYMEGKARSFPLLDEMNELYFSEVEEEEEPKLTKELHTASFGYLQGDGIDISQKTLLHMYLFMLEYVDVLDQHVTLRGFIELLESLKVEVPDFLVEFKESKSGD